VDVGHRHLREHDDQEAGQPGGGQRADDGRRGVPPGVVRLLGQRPGGVEPVQDVRAGQRRDQEGAADAAVRAGDQDCLVRNVDPVLVTPCHG